MLKVFFLVGLPLLIFLDHAADKGGYQLAIPRLPDQHFLEAVMMKENMLQLLEPLSNPFFFLGSSGLFQECLRETNGTEPGGCSNIKSPAIQWSKKEYTTFLIGERILIQGPCSIPFQDLYDLEKMIDQRTFVPAIHIRYVQFKRLMQHFLLHTRKVTEQTCLFHCSAALARGNFGQKLPNMNLNQQLLSPLVSPEITLRNRVVMAPMNRRRAIGNIPSGTAPLYYAQRAGAGLLLTDNTAVAPNGVGMMDTPGIYNAEQRTAWKKVVDEVHARKGKIFIQLVHSGRIGHPLNQGGKPLVAPSAIKAEGLLLTPEGSHLPMPEPEALSTRDAKILIEAHIQAAIHSMETGFDGVEIHGAHGFLPEQFLNPYTNQRTDRYGGSLVNRSRFLLEIMEGIVKAIGKEHTGVRLSPFAGINDMLPYEEEAATYRYLTDRLQQLGILYIHLSIKPTDGVPSIPAGYIRDLRKRFDGLLILAGGYDASSGEAVLQEGLADLVAFGRPFIANPDLVERFRCNSPLAIPDEETFYHGGDKGYIDYPALCPCI